MSRTLYITDMDGTLLNDSGRVSARSAAMISDLSRRGALISVATARTPATVTHLLAETYTTAELVVMTGAALWDRPGHRFASISLISRPQVDIMMTAFRRWGLHPFCYTLARDGRHLDVYHTGPELSPAEKTFVDQRRGLELKTFHLAQACPQEALDRVVLFFGMGGLDGVKAVAEHLRLVSDCYVSYYQDVYSPDLWLLEIFAHGVCKTAGVEALRERLGADRVVAFGDNLNDIAMLRQADVAVAVSNALPEVKAVADIVIGSNNEDSVAEFITGDFKL